MTIYATARFEVKREALEVCQQSVQEFVEYAVFASTG